MKFLELLSVYFLLVLRHLLNVLIDFGIDYVFQRTCPCEYVGFSADTHNPFGMGQDRIFQPFDVYIKGHGFVYLILIFRCERPEYRDPDAAQSIVAFYWRLFGRWEVCTALTS